MVNATADGGGGVTSALGLGGLISGINAALAAAAANEVVIDIETMDQVRDKLNTAREMVKDVSGEMNEIPASSVGGSPVAAQLKKHASLASERLLETIKEMESGLATYEQVMLTFQKDFTASDDTAHADVRGVKTNLEAGQACTGDGSTTNPQPQC